MSDDSVRFDDTGDGSVRFDDTSDGTKFGYQPRATPKPEERGYKPATPLDTSKPPQGKADAPKPKEKK